MPLVNVKTLESADFEKQSPYVLDLAGAWRFHWSGSEARAPEGFQDPAYDVTRWETVSVPSCPEALGWGSRVVAGRSVSCYRRSFTLPSPWAERKKFLDLTGVLGACTVWINGREIASGTNGVYDVTAAVDDLSSNEIAVRVVRTAGRGWSGLCGSVRLYAAPKVELRDFRVKVVPDADYLSATIEVEAEVFKHVGGISVGGIRGVADCVSKVFDEKGLEVASAPIEQVRLSTERALTTFRQKMTVDAPRFWSAESPSFYTVAVQVDHDLRARRVALRDSRQQDRAVLRAIRVSAADFEGGAAASADEIAACLSRLKRANFNAVAGAGELPVRFAECCDRYGLYVVTNPPAGLMAYCDLGSAGTASYEEAKFANSPLTVVCANAATGRAILKNAYTSLSASEFLGKWSLVRDGTEVAGGTFDLPSIPGGQRGLLELPLPASGLPDQKGECFYNLSFVTRKESPGVDAGLEIAHQQIPYAAGGAGAEIPVVEGEAQVAIRTGEGERTVEVVAGPTKAVFDRAARRFRSLAMNGQTVFAQGAGFGLFAEGLKGLRIRSGDLLVEGNTVVVTDEVLTDGEAGYDRAVRWRFSADGKVHVEVSLAPFGSVSGGPGALGFEWRPDGLSNLRFGYLGRGPWANGPEACAAASVGLYAGTAAELDGLRSGVRRFSVVNRGGTGVEIGAATPFVLEFGPTVRMRLEGVDAPFKAEKWSLVLTPVGKAAEKEEKPSGWFF